MCNCPAVVFFQDFLFARRIGCARLCALCNCPAVSLQFASQTLAKIAEGMLLQDEQDEQDFSRRFIADVLLFSSLLLSRFFFAFYSNTYLISYWQKMLRGCSCKTTRMNKALRRFIAGVLLSSGRFLLRSNCRVSCSL